MIENKYKNIIPGKPERIGGNLKTVEQVYDSSFILLNEKDLSEIALNCGASLEGDQKLVMKYFKEELVIDIGSKKLYYMKGEENEIDTPNQKCFLDLNSGCCIRCCS